MIKFSKKIFSALLSITILAAALPVSTPAFAAELGNYAATFYIDQGDVMINGDDARGYDINGDKFSAKSVVGDNGFCVTQTDPNTAAKNAVLLAGYAQVTLKSVNIDMPKKQAEDAPVLVYDGAHARVKIDHEVTLNGCHDEGDGSGTAGIQVNATASVDIYSANNDDSIDVLNASGGLGCAGIGGGRNSGYVQAGGNRSFDAGNISIHSGTLRSDAYNFETLCGAGIGGGRLGSAMSINISGGRVTAYGGSGASGIGQGAGTTSLDKNHVSDTIMINGGYVKAYAGTRDQVDIGSTTIPTSNVSFVRGTVYAGRSGYIGTSTGNNYIDGGSFLNVKSVIGKSPVSTNVGNPIVYPVKLKFPDSYDDSALTGLLVYINSNMFPYWGYNMHTAENNELTVFFPEGSCNSQFTIRGTLYTYTGTVTSSQFNVLKIDNPLTISGLNTKYAYGESVPVPSVAGGCPTGQLTNLFTGRNGTSYSSETPPTKIGTYTYNAAKLGDESYHDQTASYNFEIATNTSSLAVDQIPEQMYTGKPFTPEVTVRLGGKMLVKDTDYTLQYNKDNTKISTYMLNVIGINDCDGYTSATQYKVVPRKITFSLSGVSSDYGYTGSEIKPVVTVRDDLGNILQAGQDYGINYGGNLNVGTAIIKGYGKGNYQGSTGETTFTIKPDATPFTVSEIADVEYDGTPHIPTVTVKSGEKVLELNTDYNLKYSNLINAGTASVEIIGKGNYLGNAATVTFHIKPRTAALNIDVEDQFYTGGAINAPINVKDGNYGIATQNYSVSYTNNVNVGTATVTATGVGNYLGSSGSATFIIKPRAAALKIDQIPDQKYTGNAITPAVNVKYLDKMLLKGIDFDVSYDNNMNTGLAAAKVTGKGNYLGSTGNAAFNIVNTMNTFSIENIADQTYTGSAIIPDVVVKDSDKTLVKDTDYSIIYTNNINIGAATVTVTGKGAYAGYNGSTSFYIIPKAILLAIDTITDQTYTGSAITPAVTVRDGEYTLLKDTDYTISYSDNVSIGKAQVLVTGKGNYSGCTGNVGFNIVNTANTFSIENITDQSYTGSAIAPDLTVKAGNNTLIQDTDYSITYSNNVNVGTAAVTVTGKGAYAAYNGSTSFYIIPKTITLTINTIANQMYTGSAVMPAVTVKDGNDTLLKDTDYTISYSNNVNEGTATVNVVGKGNYLGSNGTSQFTIVKMENTFSIENIADQTYTGRAITPDVIVKTDGKTLAKDKDYTVSYANNVDAGVASVTVTGKNNYAGYNGSTTFYILSVKTAFAIDTIADQKYTGSAITPNVVVNDGDKMLVKDTDYTVSYANNVNVGAASVTVTGKGIYTGYNASATFNIVNTASTFSIENITDQTYTGGTITPTVTVKVGGSTLIQDTDYTVFYTNNVNCGTAAISVIGKGSYDRYTGYSGFYIIPKAITLNIDTISDQMYTGSAVMPAVTVKDGDDTLLKDTDYTISYSNNVNEGTGTVNVVGKGNYLGSKGTAEFTVLKKANSFSIEAILDQIFTGGAVTPDVVVKDSGKPPVKDTDYTVSYANNVNAGAASVTVTGKGDYDGCNGSTSFYIVSKKITFAIDTIANHIYTGSVITPNVIVKDGNKTLVKDTDYTVSYLNNVNIGKAAVQVTGKRNYAGSWGNANFTIANKPNQTGFTFESGSISKIFGDSDFELLTQGGQSSGAVTYTVTSGSDVVSVNGNKVTVLKAGAATITALKAGDDNYSQAQATLAIQVGKAVPVIKGLPKASDVNKGSKLSSSILTGGTANITGSFQWNDLNLKVTGSGGYNVTFYPTDTENYQQWIGKVSVKVSSTDTNNSPGKDTTDSPKTDTDSSSNIDTTVSPKTDTTSSTGTKTTDLPKTNTTSSTGTKATKWSKTDTTSSSSANTMNSSEAETTSSSSASSTFDSSNANTSSNNATASANGSELDSKSTKSSQSEKDNTSAPKTGVILLWTLLLLLSLLLILVLITIYRKCKRAGNSNSKH